jgi:phosphinothricin acetyltransferase
MANGEGNSDVAIVDATEFHLPGVMAIYNHAVRETFAIWSESETTLDQRRAWMAYRRSLGFPVIVAVSPDRPDEVLGYGSYSVFRDFPGYVNTVEHSVYIAPTAQRRGIGRAIVSELIRRARVQGLAVMVGGIDAKNEGSIAMHAGLGFERQGCLVGVGRKFGRSLDLVFMVKRL